MRNRHHTNVSAFIKLRGHLVTTMCLILLMLFGGGHRAFGQTMPDLFSDTVLPSDMAVSDADALLLEKAALKEEQDPTITRSRHVKVNMSVFQSEGPISLNLFQDVFLVMVRNEENAKTETFNTIVGQIEGEEVGLSQVLLSKLEGNLEGEILVHGRVYEIRHLGQAYHSIREIEVPPATDGEGQLDNDEVQVHSETFDSRVQEETLNVQAAGIQSTRDTGETIDIMVVYTKDARIAAGGTAKIKAQIDRTLSLTNTAFFNSGVNPRLSLVHIAEVDYTSSRNSNTDWKRLKGDSSSSLNPQVAQWRNKFGADLVNLWVENLEGAANCGWGGWNSGKLEGFSVVARECTIRNFSFMHEIGHSLGLTHDDDVGGKQGWYPYSRGFKDISASNELDKVCTIMATVKGCGVTGSDGWAKRILYFSTPNKTVRGIKIGSSTRNSTKSLNDTAKTIANYRQKPPPILSPTPGSTLDRTTVTFRGGPHGYWPDLRHWIYVGTSRGARNIKSQYMGTNPSVTVSGLPYTGTIYVRYWTALPQGWGYQDHTYTMKVPNEPPKILSPAPGSTLFFTTATFTGGHTSGDLQHYLWVGTSKGGYNLFWQNMGTSHSVTVDGLPTSGIIYVRFWTRFANGWKYQDHTYAMRGYSWNGGTGFFR